MYKIIYFGEMHMCEVSLVLASPISQEELAIQLVISNWLHTDDIFILFAFWNIVKLP